MVQALQSSPHWSCARKECIRVGSEAIVSSKKIVVVFVLVGFFIFLVIFGLF